MSAERIAQEPAKRLYEALFEGKSPEAIAASLANGIQAVIANVERLLGDIAYLLASGRIASASFLLATADEETAKVFILIDACRVDPAKHAHVLKSLCKAFYNHRLKHAYNAMRRYPPAFNGVATAWCYWTKPWWPEPADPESGEPAMPHSTYFDREMPLYVDWDFYSGKWMLPDNSTNASKFGREPELNRLDVLRGDLGQIKLAFEAGLLSSAALACLNEEWRNAYVNEKTSVAEIEEVQNGLVEHLVSKLRIPEETVRRSPLFAWPLYHFTAMRSDNT